VDYNQEVQWIKNVSEYGSHQELEKTSNTFKRRSLVVINGIVHTK
jgi:hypothetical protein